MPRLKYKEAIELEAKRGKPPMGSKPSKTVLLARGRWLSRGKGHKRRCRGVELEDQDGDEASLWIQARHLSPDHRLSRRWKTSLYLPILNGREPLFWVR